MLSHLKSEVSLQALSPPMKMLDFIGHKSFPAFDRLTGTSVLSIHLAPEIVLEMQNLQMQMLWR